MSVETIARRYATALADVVVRSGEQETVKSELSTWKELIGSSDNLKAVLTNPSIQHANKERLVDTLIAKTGPSKTTANFLRILVKNSRLDVIAEIYDRFAEELDERSGVVAAAIVSARLLPDPDRDAFRMNLERLTGKRVHIEYSVDQEIIGGVITRVGSVLYDGSVRTKLENLRAELTGA